MGWEDAPVPEGDTIWRVAARLRPALAGRTVQRFEAPRLVGPRPRVGETVEGVDAVGKHLLLRFSSGVVVRTHLRMTGSWHLYAEGERWRRPAHLARLVVGVEGWTAVCFSAPVVRSSTDPTDGVARLGPDLTAPDPDIGRAVERMGSLAEADTCIADSLLDQRVVAGIGNVYKSEVLWSLRVHPTTPVAALDVATRRALLERAHVLLRANLGPGRRVTAPTVPGGLAVYGRAGRGCPRCATPVVRTVVGTTARSTYHCPRCQQTA